jgi:hypothetical protein
MLKIIKYCFLFFLVIFSKSIYCQSNYPDLESYLSKISIAPRAGYIFDDYIYNDRTQGYFIGCDLNLPLKSNLVRFQFNHHFLKYNIIIEDLWSTGTLGKEGINYLNSNQNKIYRNEFMITYIYKIKIVNYYIDLSTGFGFYNQKSHYNSELFTYIPIGIEFGKTLNNYYDVGFEIRKNIFEVENVSSYFLGLRFAIRPFLL